MGISLHFVEKGSGTPLILLHGNGEDCGYFIHQMNAFSSDFRVIALDTRGHGQSPRGTGEFSLDRFAEDLKSFLDERGIDRADILGFSDGGNIALLFALRFPERVNRLILNGANLFPGGVKLQFQIPIVLGYAAARCCALFFDGAVRKMELLRLMVNQPNIRPEQLQALTMPVLVIAGDRDMIRDDHTRLIAESLPNSRLEILEGTHCIAWERSDEFNRVVLDFLRS